MIRLHLASQGECAWKALELLKNGCTACVIIHSQTPLQIEVIHLVGLVFPSDRRRILAENNLKSPFLSVLLWAAVNRWTGGGPPLLLLWSAINRSIWRTIRCAHVLPSISAGNCPGAAWLSPTAALGCWLRFHSELECNFAFSSSPCWPLPPWLGGSRMLSPVQELLHLSWVKSQSLGLEILFFHFCFCVAGLYVLLLRLFQAIQLMSDTSPNIYMTSEKFTLTYMWFAESELKDDCRKWAI